MTHVMLDLETFGTAANAAVVQIAAKTFNFSVFTANQHTFEQSVTLQSSLLAGASVEMDTVKWWRDQSPAAQVALSDKALPLGEALQMFSAWFNRLGTVEGVWAHGATFDPPILDMAYRSLGMRAPWYYRTPRDTRTLFWLAESDGWTPPAADPAGTPHIAAYDCTAQIASVKSAWEWVMGSTGSAGTRVTKD